jgi:hypothetical protein
MKKRPFTKSAIPERLSTQLQGKLRTALYLYMEDNETTAAETLKDGVRVLCHKQLEDIRKGRTPI